MAMKPTTIAELRAIGKSRLGSITKAEILDVIMADPNPDPAISTLIQEVRELKDIQREMRDELIARRESEKLLEDQVIVLKEEVRKQAKILSEHQVYLEKVDSKHREKNFVITGLPEVEAFDGASSDAEKVDKVLAKMGMLEGTGPLDFKRIGKVSNDRPRPILATVNSVTTRNAVTSSSAKLNSAGPAYKHVRVKKDLHPAVRREWKRLFQAQEAEKAKPENQGTTIYLDMKTRQLKRNGVVIDSWQPIQFF